MGKVIRDIYKIEFLLLLICLFSPFAAVIVTLVLSLHFKSTKLVYLLGLVIAVFLGYLNSSKELHSDFMIYYQHFMLARDLSFVDYLNNFNKEYVFYTFQYGLYFLTLGNWPIFVFIATLIPYLFLLRSIQIFMTFYDAPKRVIFAVVITSLFFYPTFSYSAHLVRNFIAASFFQYILIDLIYRRRFNGLLTIVAVGIHTSVVVVLSLISVLSRKVLRYMLIGALILLGVYSGKSYLYTKIALSLSGNMFEVFDDAPIILAFILITITLGFFSWRNLLFQAWDVNLKRYLSIFMLVLLTGYYASSLVPLLAQRLLLYSYFMLAPLFYIVSSADNIASKIISIVLPVLTIFIFIFRFSNSVFEYGSYSAILGGIFFTN